MPLPNQRPPSFTFGEYEVRQVTEADRPYIAKLIEDDDFHRDNMTPDYFLKLERGEDAWCLEKDSRVLLYFRTSTAVRVGMVFAAAETRVNRAENRSALIQGLAWLEMILAGNGFREIFFDSEGPELQLFAKRHLGFGDAPNLLQRPILSKIPPQGAGVAVGTVPTGIERAG